MKRCMHDAEANSPFSVFLHVRLHMCRHSSREYEQFRGFRSGPGWHYMCMNEQLLYLQLSLRVLTYFLHFPSPEYVRLKADVGN